MFETSVQSKDPNTHWAVLGGLTAFVLLVVVGYFMVS
jgi:hypothetical protein